MSNFETLLAEFDKTLKQFSPNMYSRLQPPLPNSDIQRLLKSVGIEDEDVYSLYQWKNGVSNESERSMIFDFECTMLNLEKVEQLKKNYKLDSNEMEGLVILFDNEEDCLLFNTNRGEDYGKLHLYSVPLLSIESPLPYFDSLSSMLKTTTEQYKQGGLVYDEGSNFLLSHSEINIKIYETFNPKSDFYNHESS